MRFALMAILGLGVVGGYGSAIARAAHWRHGGCHAGGGGWHEGRWGSRFAEARSEVKQAAPAPQTVVVQPAAAPAAPAPQIYVIMPGAQGVPAQPVVVPQVAPTTPPQ